MDKDKVIKDLKKEINKLTAESTEWEERTYCWQDRAENLQIVLDKIRKKLIEIIVNYTRTPRNSIDIADIREMYQLLEEIE